MEEARVVNLSYEACKLHARYSDNYTHHAHCGELAQGAVEYYQAAVNVAESVNLGPLTEAAVAFLLPGGIEKVRKLASGSIGIVDFLSNICRDIGQDVAVSLVTSGFGGFSNRLKKATLRTASTAVEKVSKTPMKTVAAARVTKLFGVGKFWDQRLIKVGDTVTGIAAKKRDKIFGIIQEGKRKFGGDIRADLEGHLYKFDRLHKTGKVHLEKIVKRNDGFYLIGEVDPDTGAVLRMFKNPKRM